MIDINLVIALVVFAATIIGSTVPLYLSGTRLINEIHKEMKDFHGRLCAIEAKKKK